MAATTDPDGRTAQAGSTDGPDGPVTLINSFLVSPGRDGAFTELWKRTSAYFRGQPGFVDLRLHRAVSPDTQYRYVNVARWASTEQYIAAHRAREFHDLVSQPEWREFPSSPALYELIAEHARPVDDRSTVSAAAS